MAVRSAGRSHLHSPQIVEGSPTCRQASLHLRDYAQQNNKKIDRSELSSTVLAWLSGCSGATAYREVAATLREIEGDRSLVRHGFKDWGSQDHAEVPDGVLEATQYDFNEIGDAVNASETITQDQKATLIRLVDHVRSK